MGLAPCPWSLSQREICARRKTNQQREFAAPKQRKEVCGTGVAQALARARRKELIMNDLNEMKILSSCASNTQWHRHSDDDDNNDEDSEEEPLNGTPAARLVERRKWRKTDRHSARERDGAFFC